MSSPHRLVPTGPYERLDVVEMVVGDTETSGLAPYGLLDGVPTNDPHGPDRLCSAAFLRMVRTNHGWKNVERQVFQVDPGRPIPAKAAAVNGFHWSGDGSPVPEGRIDLVGRRPFAAVAQSMLDFIGDRPFCFHNAVFDVSVLDAELERCGLAPLAVPALCTKQAFSDMRGLGRPYHYVPQTNLNALCDLLGVERSSRTDTDGRELHGAEVDALLAAECMGVLDGMGWMVPEDCALLPHRLLPIYQESFPLR